MEEEKIAVKNFFSLDDLEKCLVDCEISNEQLDLMRNSGIRDIKGLVKIKIRDELARHLTEKFVDYVKIENNTPDKTTFSLELFYLKPNKMNF